MLTAYKRIHWFNSDFHSSFLLNDNQKITEISFDVNPFQIDVNNNLKVVTYIRDSTQSKPIQIKLKEPYNQSREVFNDDNEAFPIIYINHTGTESMNTYYPYSIARLIPQQIPRFTFRVDDNYNQFIGNSYITSITNGQLSRVAFGGINEKYVLFLNSGSFTLTDKMVVDILVVGGGGGGGGDIGGGGGAGGVIYQKGISLSSGTYSITVGAGGIGSPQTTTAANNDVSGTNGGDSFIQFGGSDLIINGITYRGFGGGGGGRYGYPSSLTAYAGNNGGSGGGGGNAGLANTAAGGTKTQGNTYFNGTTNVSGGNNGANGNTVIANSFIGGGGGGAGGAGIGKNGGAGVQIDIIGTNQWYAAGGGGGVIGDLTGLGGSGGNGIGGDGNYIFSGGAFVRAAKHSGTNGTGSGGGGGAYKYDNNTNGAGDGGSGVVIIRFTEQRNRIEGITPDETLIQATNNNIPITIDSQYQINYQTPTVLPKGTYESIFNNGAITFKSKPDYSYPTTSNMPIAWYKFDTNSLILDSSGNGCNLTNNNTAVINQSDFIKGNGSLSLNGTNQYLSTTNGFNLNNKNFSISAWLKPKDTNFNICFNIGTSLSQNQMLHVGLYNGGIKYGFFADDYDPAYSWSINNWYHIVWTFNTTSKLKSIYANGSLVGSTTAAGQLNTNNTIYIGYHNNDYFNGLIDDLRVFDYVLSPAEVYDLYNGNTDRSYPILKDVNNTTIEPINWYKFDTGSLLIDSGTLKANLIAINTAPTADTNNFIKGTSSCLSIRNTTTGNYLTSVVNLTTPFTISFWFNINNANNNSPFGLGADDTSPAISCTYNSSTNKIVTYLATPNTWNTILTSTANININTWYHYTLTISNANPVLSTLYINGVLDTSGSGVSTFSTNNKNLRINIRGDLAAVDSFGGYIDDFRIYSQVLTVTQVAELYKGRLAIYNPPGFILGTEIEPE